MVDRVNLRASGRDASLLPVGRQGGGRGRGEEEASADTACTKGKRRRRSQNKEEEAGKEENKIQDWSKSGPIRIKKYRLL